MPASQMHSNPLALIQVAFTDEDACQWRWLRSVAPDQAAKGWEVIPAASQRVYVPSFEDLGRRLRVECTPVRCCTGTATCQLCRPNAPVLNAPSQFCSHVTSMKKLGLRDADNLRMHACAGAAARRVGR